MTADWQPHTWEPGVTPYSSDRMNAIEQAIAGARPVGEILAGPTVFPGCLPLDGSEISRTTYSRLWDYADSNDLVGSFFGAGDGSTTFVLPDTTGRFLRGATAGDPPGATGGSTSHAHSNPSTGAAGGHSHSNPSTGPAGSHSHSNPSTGSAGSHTHSQGSTSSASVNMSEAGSHSHSTGGPSATVAIGTQGTITANPGSGAHSHSTNTAGSHTHGGTSHSHGLPTVNSNGSHSHSQGNTGSAGSHSHSIASTGSVSSHSHSIGDTGSVGHLPPWLSTIHQIRY